MVNQSYGVYQGKEVYIIGRNVIDMDTGEVLDINSFSDIEILDSECNVYNLSTDSIKYGLIFNAVYKIISDSKNLSFSYEEGGSIFRLRNYFDSLELSITILNGGVRVDYKESDDNPLSVEYIGTIQEVKDKVTNLINTLDEGIYEIILMKSKLIGKLDGKSNVQQ